MGCWSIAGLPPSIMFVGTHLYTWVDRLTVGVKCLAQEHNTISPARTWTQTARSGVEHTNHKAMAPQSQTRLHVKRSLQLSPSMSLQGPGYTCIVHFHASRIFFLSISLNPNNNPAVSQSTICKQWKILKTDIKVHLTFLCPVDDFSRVLRRSINNARLYKKNKKTPASQQYCMFYNRFGKNPSSLVYLLGILATWQSGWYVWNLLGWSMCTDLGQDSHILTSCSVNKSLLLVPRETISFVFICLFTQIQLHRWSK